MALTLNGTTQWLTAAVDIPQTPFTFMAWFRKNGYAQHAMVAAGVPGVDEMYEELHWWGDTPRAITFMPIATAAGTEVLDTVTYHFVMATFSGTQVILYQDGAAPVTTAYAAASNILSELAIGVNAILPRSGQANGAIAHVAIWNTILTGANRDALFARTVNPANVETANLLGYLPFQTTLLDDVGLLPWVPVALASPAYEADGIAYPAASPSAVTYNGNGNTGGSVPVDSSSPYAQGVTVTTMTNSGNLVKSLYTFTGWNTNAAGTGTHYNVGATFVKGSTATVLYAEWTLTGTIPVYYYGSYSSGGDVPVDSTLYRPGDSVTVLANPGNLVRTGYTLIGWKNTP